MERILRLMAVVLCLCVVMGAKVFAADGTKPWTLSAKVGTEFNDNRDGTENNQ